MKLARFMSLAGVASRRKSEELIRQGLVVVNGQVVDRPEERVSSGDEVFFRGKVLEIPVDKVYLLLNKPPGVLTTMHDPQGRPKVADLVSDIQQRVYPVGRLDQDASGLLLLTNDGDLANRLQHPRYGVKKTYRVKVRGIPSEEKVQQLREGILLEEGKTAPAGVKLLRTNKKKNEALLEITLRQGWKRQIKRMCRAVNLSVKQLKRTGFAFLDLQGVKEGEYRYLTVEEVKSLKEEDQ